MYRGVIIRDNVPDKGIHFLHNVGARNELTTTVRKSGPVIRLQLSDQCSALNKNKTCGAECDRGATAMEDCC
jgi:hypothetical protein